MSCPLCHTANKWNREKKNDEHESGKVEIRYACLNLFATISSHITTAVNAYKYIYIYGRVENFYLKNVLWNNNSLPKEHLWFVLNTKRSLIDFRSYQTVDVPIHCHSYSK